MAIATAADLEQYAALAAGVHQYAEDAVAGRLVVNRYVRLAAARHLDDLEHGHRRGLSFDAAAAGRPLAFFPMLRLAEGDVADGGRPFILTPSQVFTVGSMFGWKREDPEDGAVVRRFRNGYVETGKGSGKTPLGAGIGLYGLVADVEAAPEVYSAAPSRDQSKIPWTDARRMVEASKALRDRIDVTATALAAPRRNGTFQYLSSEAKNLHGHRPHIVLVEEEHAHPNSDVIDAMRLGTKGRRNALIVRLTNSGVSRHSVCWADHEYSVRILERELADDAWFAFVCGLDMCDEHRNLGRPEDGCPGCDQWTDEAVWPKANPNIGVTIGWQYLRETVTEAVGKPSARSIVKRLNFCIWATDGGAWLDAARFREIGPDPEAARPLPAPAGLRGFGGLDLSSTTDLASAAGVFPRPSCDVDGHVGRCYDLRVISWVPEDRIADKARVDKVPYDLWAAQGWIRPTRGNRVDQERIFGDLEAEWGGVVGRVGIDRWNAGWMTPKLQDAGFQVVEVGQGFASLSAPSKRLEADIAEGLVHHDGNPVLLWMVGNAAADQDEAGNIKPAKGKSTDRIDGVAAWADAIFASLVHEPAQAPSVYDQLTAEELAERMLL